MIFELGTTIVELDSPAQYPMGAVATIAQAKEKSASGVAHVENFVVKTGVRRYTFVDMSTNDFNRLLNFFLDTAVAMLNEFLLTDDIGGQTTVRFLEPTLNFTNDSYGLWSGSFSVEEIT